MDIEYKYIIDEWYNGKSTERIYNMIVEWINKYPKLLEIEELNNIINKIDNSIDNDDSINDIVEEFIKINLSYFFELNQVCD